MFFLAFFGSLVKFVIYLIYICTCLFLILAVLVRQGETGGLSGADVLLGRSRPSA